jgi:hypothetical protein
MQRNRTAAEPAVEAAHPAMETAHPAMETAHATHASRSFARHEGEADQCRRNQGDGES